MISLEPSCQRGQSCRVWEVRGMIFIGDSPRAAAARPPRPGGGTRAVHPGSAHRRGPATPRPASARSPTDQPHFRDGVMGGAKRPSRDQCRTVAREASDAMDAHGCNSLGEGHSWQHDGELRGQHRPARPRGGRGGAQIWVGMPASALALPCSPRVTRLIASDRSSTRAERQRARA